MRVGQHSSFAQSSALLHVQALSRSSGQLEAYWPKRCFGDYLPRRLWLHIVQAQRSREEPVRKVFRKCDDCRLERVVIRLTIGSAYAHNKPSSVALCTLMV